MGKKVLVISTSLRKNSNSEALAASFVAGAQETGCEVAQLSLRGKSIDFCKGCMACQKTLHCIIKDDANAIVEQIGKADVLVFATPIYYYGMSGQMKTLLDRANPLFPSDYAFRDVYLLATAADEDENAVAGAKKGMEGWISCFPKSRLKGVLFCGGVTDTGDIDGNKALEKARQMGRALNEQ